MLETDLAACIMPKKKKKKGQNKQNKHQYNIYIFSLVFYIVDGSLKTHPRNTDMQAKLILFLYECFLSFMCFLISSFATQMCLHNGYANIMYAVPTAPLLIPNKPQLLWEQMCLMATPQLLKIKLGVERERRGGAQERDLLPSGSEGNSFTSTVCCRC